MFPVYTIIPSSNVHTCPVLFNLSHILNQLSYYCETSVFKTDRDFPEWFTISGTVSGRATGSAKRGTGADDIWSPKLQAFRLFPPKVILKVHHRFSHGIKVTAALVGSKSDSVYL